MIKPQVDQKTQQHFQFDDNQTDAKITAYVLQVIPTIKQKQTQKQQCLNKLNLQVFFKKICNKTNSKRHSFHLNFTPYQDKQPLRHMELQEKEVQKD